MPSVLLLEADRWTDSILRAVAFATRAARKVSFQSDSVRQRSRKFLLYVP